MQLSEPEKKSKSRSDEDSINFRPSPNFKHMRKYLKSKLEEANQMANQSASNGTSDLSVRHNEREKVNEPSTSVVQPPLPPNPPPPESPPMITLKKEIEDDEYGTNVIKGVHNQSENLLKESIKTEVSDKPEVIMCRNFARGTCKKGAACIFTHELILSQLPGVYTFCRNFQNSVCTFPKCKFVHATVFEKEHFYRTGFLPPHTLSHLKENQPLPPPPPPPICEDIPTKVPQVVFNSLPPQNMSCITLPVMTGTAVPPVEAAEANVFRAAVPTSSTKREWSDTEDRLTIEHGTHLDLTSFVVEVNYQVRPDSPSRPIRSISSPFDIVSCEPPAKKCKNCDSNEFRLQYNKFMAEKMVRASEDMKDKLAILQKKSARLSTVLLSVFKYGDSAGNNVSNSSESKNKPIANSAKILAEFLLRSSNPSVPPGF